MEQKTTINEITLTDEKIKLRLVANISCNAEELAGIIYRMRRNGEVALANEIEEIAQNVWRKS